MNCRPLVSTGGFATGTIDLGGLEVRQVSTFAKVWSTGRDAGGAGATFYRPSPVPAGFWALGHYAQRDDRPLFGHVLVARDTSSSDTERPILAHPRDYTLVWSSPDGAGCFWLPAAPDGYMPIGVVATATPDKPPLGEVRCVRADFTDACEAEAPAVWSGGGGGFSAAVLRPAARRVDARGVHAGTFLARSGAAAVEASALVACLKNNGASHTCAMPDLAQVHAVLAAYAPVVYLHPDEPYMPSSVAWFFENGALLHRRDDGNGGQAPAPVAADGSNLPQGGDNDGEYWLDLPAGRDRRERAKRGDLAGAKAYVQVKPMLGGTATDLAMWFFYPFNGPARGRVAFATVPLGGIGSHVGDWEHLTLRVSNFSGELLRVYFSQHSAGAWVDAPRLEYGGGGGRPVAYASLHGHAFYPRAGLELQGSPAAGIRNDSAKGSVLDTGGAGQCEVVSAEYLGVAEPAWLGFMRPWGPTEVYAIGRVINGVAWLLPRAMRERLERLVKKLFVGDGATGPKKHGSWINDERDPK